ncbi:MAG: hypothetical protein M3Q48_15085 [Actinomycetota bacterium]|nr:hypothetical protein [Actinomycetota bacterium]
MTALLLATTAAVLLPAPTAHADGTADAFNEGDGVSTAATDGGAERGQAGAERRRVSKVTCTYQLLDAEASATADRFAVKGWGSERGEGPGAWYRKICRSETGAELATVIWVRARPPADPRSVAEDAADRAPIPLPDIRLSPPVGSDQVVNVPTWLWIDTTQWRPVSASATAGAVTATATAVPESVVWSMGNGDTVACSGPGTPYQPGRQQPGCAYTFRRSSAAAPGGTFTVAATVTWRLSWTATGAPGGGALGTVTRTTEIPVRVAEIQALNR